jgi:hypothetical protein
MNDTPITRLIKKYQEYAPSHAAGSLNTKIIAAIERLPGVPFNYTIETGCGKSTILFSNISEHHVTFCLDDRTGKKSNVNYFLNCPYTGRVQTVYGPTQITLPSYKFEKAINLALLDGPHGFPFPEIEYYYIYPHLADGAYLIIDDIQIPSIGAFFSVVKEDEMFEAVDVVNGKTAILRRTSAPTFDPLGDGWWKQRYNKRRVPRSSPFYENSCPWASLAESAKLTLKVMLRKLNPL